MATVNRVARSHPRRLGIGARPGGAGLAADDVKVVASGLDNPRGLDFGPGGDLYVAEAGRGGSSDRAWPARAPAARSASGPAARSRASSPTATTRSASAPACRRWPARAAPTPAARRASRAREGIKDLGFLTIGLGGNPAQRSTFGAPGALLATVQRMHPDGRHRTLADLGAFEAANDPDKDLPEAAVPDTNPTALYALNNREVDRRRLGRQQHPVRDPHG